jgi:hypothetical protein
VIRVLPLPALIVLAACSARPLVPTTGPYALEWETFSGEDQEKLHGVFDLPTAMVELPLTKVETRTELFEYLLTDLVFTAGVLRAQKKAVYKLWRDVGDPPGQVRFDDTAGICLVAQLLKKEPGRWVFYSKGIFDFGILSVPGSTVIIVVHEEREGALWTHARVYAKVEGVVLESGARFLGLIEGAIRRRAFVFIEASCAVAEMAAKDPDQLLRDIEGSPEVDAESVEKFRRLVGR